MNNPNIQFKILVVQGKTVGISLLGVGQTEAEQFCRDFGKAYKTRGARIEFCPREIVFKHDGEEFHAAVTDEEAQTVFDLLNKRGEYTGLEPELELCDGFGIGFEITVAEAA